MRDDHHWRWPAVVVVGAALTAGVVTAPVGSRREAFAARSPALAEAPAADGQDDDIADMLRRAPVPEGRHEEADRIGELVDAVMPRGQDRPCVFDEVSETCSMDIRPPTVEQVRAALRKAGLPAAVVRMARPGDPAPAGSLLVAVPAGALCLLRFDTGETGASGVAGQLPGGLCVTP